jgi:hypothetical protein
VSECDREASIMRRPRPTRGCCAMGGGGGRENLLKIQVYKGCEFVSLGVSLLFLGNSGYANALQCCVYTGHTQKNGAGSIVFTIETAPFFCVYSVLILPVLLNVKPDGT